MTITKYDDDLGSVSELQIENIYGDIIDTRIYGE